MTILSRVRLLIPAVLALIGGCRVDSLNPITPVERAQNDKALFGVWRATDRDNTMYVHIAPKNRLAGSADSGVGRVADARRMDIVIIEHHASGLTQESYTAHVSEAGRYRFLNVEIPQKGGDPGGYYFVRYALTGKNLLRVSLIDGTALGAMIKSGKIKGVIKDTMLPETVITADSAEILEFIERNQASLFAKPLLLNRVPEDTPKRSSRCPRNGADAACASPGRKQGS